MRLLVLSHVKSGANKAETARYLKVSRRIVNEWVARFYAKGIDGLREKKRGGVIH